MLRGAYNAFLIPLRIAYPFYALGARLSGRPESEMRERLGVFEPLPGRPVWIQAASVGETGIAALLARRLLREDPSLPLLVTTTTRTGRAAAERTLPESVARRFFPLDFRASVRRALDAVAPRAIVLVETELWPNLLTEASARGVPVVIVNGRLSDRAYRRSRLAASLFHEILADLSCACVQTPLDAERFAGLGLPRERIRITGNVKFAATPASTPDAGAARASLGVAPDVEVWVCGSTAEGEEDAALDAFRGLPRNGARRLLVIAPRKPERFEAVAQRLSASGLHWRRRSASAAAGPSSGDAEVLLLDTLGELTALYAAATCAFVGGTLAPRGGHNIIEPAACGIAPIFGPHIENVRDVAARLVEAGGAFPVGDAAELTRTFARLAADPALRRRAGEKAREVVAAQSGSLETTLDEIRPFLRMQDRALA